VNGRTPRLLTAALAAAGRGWPVFPVVPYGKRPAIRGWPQQATCDRDRLAVWFQQAPYNVGIACGPAGLLVVDLDRPATGQAPLGDWAGSSVHDGREVLAVLAHRSGQPDPRDTYTVATPRGEHRYFTVPTMEHPARCTAGTLGWLIDTRGAGGYVIAAGSVRRLDGRRRYYQRTSPHGLDPAPAPAWLLDVLAPPLDRTVSRSDSPRHPDAYVRAALHGEADQVRRAAVGTRNTTVFHAARRLAQLAAAGLLEDQHIIAVLTEAAAHHTGSDGFTGAEAAAAIGNGLRYGHRHPRGGR
jgi:hypothetical protein